MAWSQTTGPTVAPAFLVLAPPAALRAFPFLLCSHFGSNRSALPWSQGERTVHGPTLSSGAQAAVKALRTTAAANDAYEPAGPLPCLILLAAAATRCPWPQGTRGVHHLTVAYYSGCSRRYRYLLRLQRVHQYSTSNDWATRVRFACPVGPGEPGFPGRLKDLCNRVFGCPDLDWRAWSFRSPSEGVMEERVRPFAWLAGCRPRGVLMEFHTSLQFYVPVVRII